MAPRDKHKRQPLDIAQLPKVRGAPYKATRKKAGSLSTENSSTSADLHTPAAILPKPTSSSTKSPPSQPSGGREQGKRTHPPSPKVSFGGHQTLDSRSKIVAASVIGFIVVLAAVLLAVGSRLSGTNTTAQPTLVAPGVPDEGQPVPPSVPATPTSQHIVFGKFVLVVPEGWQVIEQGADFAKLRNPSLGALMHVRFFYSGSLDDLRPPCPSSPTPSPTAMPGTPSPIFSPTAGFPSYKVKNSSSVSVADSIGNMVEGDLICAKGASFQFASVLAKQPAIGISFLGDSTELRFLLPDLIRPA